MTGFRAALRLVLRLFAAFVTLNAEAYDHALDDMEAFRAGRDPAPHRGWDWPEDQAPSPRDGGAPW